MSRVLFLVDGFNMFHALHDTPKYHKYKWLDYSVLAKCFIRPNDKIVGVLWFTAYANWGTDRANRLNRHKSLRMALEWKEVEVVLGKFKRRHRKCKVCGQIYKSREEKQTDVNIAIRLFRGAMDNVFDTAMIVTADGDLIPAIEAVKKSFPSKKIGLIVPIGRWDITDELRNICDFSREMKPKDLRDSQFPDTIVVDPTKGTILHRPPNWK